MYQLQKKNYTKLFGQMLGGVVSKVWLVNSMDLVFD